MYFEAETHTKKEREKKKKHHSNVFAHADTVITIYHKM